MRVHLMTLGGHYSILNTTIIADVAPGYIVYRGMVFELADSRDISGLMYYYYHETARSVHVISDEEETNG